MTVVAVVLIVVGFLAIRWAARIVFRRRVRLWKAAAAVPLSVLGLVLVLLGTLLALVTYGDTHA